MQERCDTYLIGRKTYEVVLLLTGGTFPQAALYECFVLSKQDRQDEKGVQFYKGPIELLVKNLQKKEGKDIYCDGGGEVVHLLMSKNLIDEYIISVIPTILGDGIRLFKGGTLPINTRLKNSQQYKSGLVQLRYERI